MLLHRRLNVPRMPNNLQELCQVIAQFEPIRSFYRGSCVGADNLLALVFIHEHMLDAIKDATVLFIDGTFDVRLVYINIFYTYILIY